MPTTRSAARKGDSNSPESVKSAAGSKRKADTTPSSSPAAKSKKSQAPKKQKTIEETLPDEANETKEKDQEASKDVEMKDAVTDDQNNSKDHLEGNETVSKDPNSTDVKQPAEKTSETGQNSTQVQDNDKNKDQQIKSSAEGINNSETKPTSTSEKTVVDPKANTSEKTSTNDEPKKEAENTEVSDHKTNGTAQPAGKEDATTSQDAPKAANGDGTKPTQDTAIDQSSEREKSTPSSILEKGIIYFFFRGRVGIDDPSNVDDLARSYIVLRPLPRGAKLSDGPLGDAKNLRVLALPKKVLPKGPNDRFMVFVEKAKTNLEDLKKEFLSASDYDTKTAGPRHTPAATPVGEGVYAITSTGRESHLAYLLTIPQTLNEVQKDIGLETKGSWVASVKNPQHKGPAQAQLPNDPEFPQEILDEFRTLRWGPLQPKHLDYENCQFLLIGHKDHSFAKATETDDKEADPKEEIEKLGEEDERRVEHLEGDDTVFEDLNIDAKEYPSVQTTW